MAVTESGETASAMAQSKSSKRAGAPDYLASFRLFIPYVAGSRAALAASVLLATVAAACELTPIWAVYRIVEAAAASGVDWTSIVFHAGIAAAGVVLGFLATGLATGLSHVVAFDVIHRLRLVLARHMARLPMGYFADRRSGDAKKTVIDEPEKLEAIIAHGAPEGVSALATWLAVTIWLFAVDWRMALAAVVMTPASFVLLMVGMTRGGRRAADYQAAGARMNASILEFLSGMSVVKIFNRSGEAFADTSDAVRAYVTVETAWAKDHLPFGGAFFTLALTNIVVILPAGLILLHAGAISLPTLLLFVILGANYSQPLLKLFNQFHTLAHVSMGSMRVEEVLATPSQPNSGQTVALASHDVAFEGVSFGYGPRCVLHDVNFVARAGEMTALVGLSGSGKSTIASLIPRLWDVGAGRVTVGGVDVREMGLDQLMETVAFVFQVTFLFADTVEANIRFGKPDAADVEVEAAAAAARAHDFITTLPQGYATRIGEQGHALSGGERQRIAIARAVLKNAPIIVLDEATAFADPDNEAAIQEALGALTAGRTLIVVAHRLHTIAAADQILVVDGGRIVECGQHDELVGRNGRYARLWEDYTHAQAIALRPSSEFTIKEAAQ